MFVSIRATALLRERSGGSKYHMPSRSHSSHICTCARFPRSAAWDACVAARQGWGRTSKRWREGGRPDNASVGCLNRCARLQKRVKRVYLLVGDGGCDAQPLQAERLQKSLVSDRTASVARIVPVATLVLRTFDAADSVVASLAAAAGTESSCEAEGRMG